MQTDGALQRIVGYNTDNYKDASHFHNIDEKISIDVKRSIAGNSVSWWSETTLQGFIKQSIIQHRPGPKITSHPTITS